MLRIHAGKFVAVAVRLRGAKGSGVLLRRDGYWTAGISLSQG